MFLSNAKKITLTIMMLVMSAMLFIPPANAGGQGANCGNACKDKAGCGTDGTCMCTSSSCNCQCTGCSINAPECCLSCGGR